MDQTTEAQRTELHRTTWRVADDRRGSVSSWMLAADLEAAHQ